jgi:pimeloyl-ACP methyl ester carboxylesterase
VTAIIALGLAAAIAANAAIRTTQIEIPDSSQQLAIHCVEPSRPSRSGVLFIHGATFPTRLASGYEFSPNDSWLAFVAAEGYLACGFDFVGFGASSRPAAMLEAADRAAPVLRVPEAAEQIALAVSYLRGKRGLDAVHVVAHSWGTLPAAAFAAVHSAEIRSLTLFGPVVPAPGTPEQTAKRGAWYAMKAEDRLERLHFRSALPAGKSLLDPQVDERWAREYAASSPIVAGDAPGVVRIPEGPNADVDAATGGELPYAPADVRVPVFVVYGNYDVIVDDAGASAFVERFTASPLKWRMRIDDGTHVMHLDRTRRSLYESVAAFQQVAQSSADASGATPSRIGSTQGRPSSASISSHACR